MGAGFGASCAGAGVAGGAAVVWAKVALPQAQSRISVVMRRRIVGFPFRVRNYCFKDRVPFWGRANSMVPSLTLPKRSAARSRASFWYNFQGFFDPCLGRIALDLWR